MKLKSKSKNIKLVLMLLFCTSLTSGQKSDLGNWFIYFGSQKISNKLNFWNEIQYRNYNFIGDLEQLLIRTGLGYNLSQNNNNVLLGYGFVRSENYTVTGSKNAISEHRIYQQFITKQNFLSVFIQHRYRIEERFLPNDFKWRFRYFLSLNKPLNRRALTKNAVYFSAYNEIFLGAKEPVFDRNRLYGGIGYCINNELRIETGIMTQMFEDRKRSQWQIIFFNSIPFSK